MTDRLAELLDRFVADLSATVAAALVGDGLGFYRALADAGPLTPAELADYTGTGLRYVREWLGGQVARGVVAYDEDTGR
jgi:hypothetical protein